MDRAQTQGISEEETTIKGVEVVSASCRGVAP